MIPEFDQLRKENSRWYRRFAGNSRELMSLLAAFRNAGLSVRGLVARRVSNAGQLSMQAGVIEKAVSDSNAGASDQSAIVSEVTRTIEELQTTFNRTEKIARDVFTVSEQALNKGREGNASVQDAQSSMLTIWRTSDAARAQMTALEDLSAQIARVVKSLEQIADNSQMLAINASIEAAEAGEAGRGFAVVASEIQELAVQSVNATRNIRSFLQQIADTADKAIRMTDVSQQAVVANGQNSLTSMEELLRALIQVLDSNNQHADQISRTVTEQSVAISQISQAVDHVFENSQQSARSLTELLKAVAELNRTRDEFEKLAAEYQV